MGRHHDDDSAPTSSMDGSVTTPADTNDTVELRPKNDPVAAVHKQLEDKEAELASALVHKFRFGRKISTAYILNVQGEIKNLKAQLGIKD